MPIYEYQCTDCGKIEEALQKVTDAPLTTCGHCSGKLNKLISHSAFHLKGSGWYVTDYANKGNPPPAATTETSGSEPSPSPEKSKTADTKTKTTNASTASGD
jgi:putative FmdB family regulatory protein